MKAKNHNKTTFESLEFSHNKYNKAEVRSLILKTKFLIISTFLIFSCRYEKRIKVDLDNTIAISSLDSINRDVLQIGVAAMLSPENALPTYEEIVDYIGRKMGQKTKMLFTKDYASMNKLVKNQKVVAAFVCSGPYVSGHDKWGMQLIAAPVLYGDPTYYSYILANKNSRITKFEELEGKKFAFTDPNSNTGKLVPTYELSRIGKTPDNFFSEYIFTGSHDKSIEAVAENLVDGAAVDHLIWEYLNNTDPTFTSKTKIIAKLGPFAIPPFVMHPDCNEELKDTIRKILLEMHTVQEGRKILDKIHIDKFVIIEDDSYQSIREMNEWIHRMKTQH